MFSKRKFKKVDICEGIVEKQDSAEDKQQEQIQKKVKFNNVISGDSQRVEGKFDEEPQVKEKTLVKPERDHFATEIEKEIDYEYQTNPVLQTLQRFKAITSIDQIDPKKALPNTDPAKQIKYKKGHSQNLRFTSRFDYNPSLCKDYHDTGYCTFGDSCIYIHDRGDYKSGWEQENDWQEAQKKKQLKLAKEENGEEVEDDDQELLESLSKYDLPEKCSLCDELFQIPVMTTCNHFFCEKCALDNHKSNPRCFQCSKITNGIFQDAKNQIKRIKEKREQIRLDHYIQYGNKEAQKRTKSGVLTTVLFKPPNEKNEEDEPTIVEINEDIDVQQLKRKYRQEIQNKVKGFQKTESDWLL